MSNQIATTNQNGQMQKAQAGGKDLRAFLSGDSVKAKLAEVANAAMKPDDLIRLALMACSRQPKLLECTQASILRALIEAAELGIRPGGMNGRGYLVPRYNKEVKALEACFDPGWRGLIDVARRSGIIQRIEASVVFEQDTFEVEKTPFTKVRHIPSESQTPGPVRAAFACAGFKDGAEQIEIVWRRDLDKIQAVSAAKGFGPWKDWYEEMARKSAIRRLCKYLPHDPMMERALRASDLAESSDAEFFTGHRNEPGLSQSRRLANKISATALPPGTGSAMPDVNPSSEVEVVAASTPESQRSGSNSTQRRRPDAESDGEPPEDVDLGDAHEGDR